MLAGLGYTVIIPSRPGLEKEAEGTKSAILKSSPEAKLIIPDDSLNLGSLASVRKFAAAMKSSQQRIDLLCLNAGRGGGAKDPREETVDGLEAIMQVNIIGHFLLATSMQSP